MCPDSLGAHTLQPPRHWRWTWHIPDDHPDPEASSVPEPERPNPQMQLGGAALAIGEGRLLSTAVIGFLIVADRVWVSARLA